MAGEDNPFAGMSDEQLKAMAGKFQAPAEQKSATPAKVLEGRAEFTEPMKDRDEVLAKNYLPQPDDSGIMKAIKYGMLIPRGISDGAGQATEDVSNAGLGAAQQVMGVPQDKRMTTADIGRAILGPKFVSPGEMEHAPAFQAGLAQDPSAQRMYNSNKFVGGMVAPIGHGISALAQLPIRFAGEAANAIPTIAKAGGKAIELAQNSVPAKIIQPGSRQCDSRSRVRRGICPHIWRRRSIWRESHTANSSSCRQPSRRRRNSRWWLRWCRWHSSADGARSPNRETGKRLSTRSRAVDS